MRQTAGRKPQRRIRLLVGLTLILLVVIVGMVAFLDGQLGGDETPAPLTAPAVAGATFFDPPRLVPDGDFINDAGERVSLSDFRGRYVNIYFGYTNCPDFCPMHCTSMRRTKDELMTLFSPEEVSELVSFIFISVDIQRDTPERLGGYLHAFDQSFIGLTSESEEALQTFGAGFGLVYQRANISETGEYYSVDHSTYSYLINPAGDMIAMYIFGHDSRQVAHNIYEDYTSRLVQ